eukprot:1021341-Pleurochrysis_carterae.AAC.2
MEPVPTTRRVRPNAAVGRCHAAAYMSNQYAAYPHSTSPPQSFSAANAPSVDGWPALELQPDPSLTVPSTTRPVRKALASAFTSLQYRLRHVKSACAHVSAAKECTATRPNTYTRADDSTRLQVDGASAKRQEEYSAAFD